MMQDRHRISVNTIKGLAMDAVQAANSGHPGMPMGMADVASILWTQFLKHDPADPQWPDRDRFVLSAGHGSMLLYSLLHLSGYNVSVDDIKQFRQWGSKTPGHPEYGDTEGVETTTGPLGQGFANGVGMAIAERFLRETFGPDLIDHYTYAIVSDGDLMEGLASEAASIAGHLGLGRIVYLYDDNHITIDGSIDLSFTEDRGSRFAAYGWHVQCIDGHDPAAITAAIEAARSETARPSIICCNTIIGKDCDIEGSSKTHGAALGEERVRRTKTKLGMDPEAHFVTPQEAYAHFRQHDGPAERATWEARLREHPRRDEFRRWWKRDGAALVKAVQWPTFDVGTSLATRKASAACLKAITAAAPWVIGGSADLGGSNGTAIGLAEFSRDRFAGAGTINFGVREHSMAALCNGMALHGGVTPYNATFLIFHDYMRPSVRLSSLMRQQVIYVYSHDSVFLGEDGPTHQPVETLLALRSIPGIQVIRPGDAAETTAAWQIALRRENAPTAIILTRQGLPVLDRERLASASGTERGGYILADCEGRADVVLMATGSEVATILDAQAELKTRGIKARVVSLPCRELFWEQDRGYRAEVFPPGVPRVSVEAGITMGWDRYIGEDGLAIGIDRFGASAPWKVLAEKFGLTGAQVAERAQQHLTSAARG
jgi:transketolase